MSETYEWYCIVREQPNEGTETLESYGEESVARAAFAAIEAKGYHVAETDEGGERIKLNAGDTFYLSIEVWDCDTNTCTHEHMEHVPFTL